MKFKHKDVIISAVIFLPLLLILGFADYSTFFWSFRPRG